MIDVTDRGDVIQQRTFIEQNLPVSSLLISGLTFLEKLSKGGFGSTFVTISDVSLSACTLIFSMRTTLSAGIDSSSAVTEKCSLKMGDIGLPTTVVQTSSEGHDHFHLRIRLTSPTTVQISGKHPITHEPMESTKAKSDFEIPVKGQEIGARLAEAFGIVVTACKAA
jgi:hypothetical protein